MIRKAFFILVAGAMALFSLLLHAQSRIDAGTVVTSAGTLNVPVYRVAVECADSDVSALARRVLPTHGSFNLAAKSNAQIIFSITRTSPTSVRLSLGGVKGFDRSFSGEDWREALMKALDAATEAILGTPGYFNGKIAFTHSSGANKPSQIYLSDIGFQKVKALTADKTDSIMPHISPDGTKVSYTGYFRSGFMDLFEINLNTKTRRTLASYKGSNTGGAYSPDGSKIAMILSTTGNAEIWVGSASGKGLKRLTRTSATESSASFNADGSKIVFCSDPRGAPLIYTMPVSGGKISSVPTNISNYCSEPAWNWRDPNKIAFTAAVSRGFQVAVCDLKQRRSEWITSGGNTSWPVWLNDGRHLICTRGVRGGKTSLWLVDTATKKQTKLHSDAFGNTSEASFAYPSR